MSGVECVNTLIGLLYLFIFIIIDLRLIFLSPSFNRDCWHEFNQLFFQSPSLTFIFSSEFFTAGVGNKYGGNALIYWCFL